jgi:ABC-type sugar transport system ATPase subunit
MGRTGATYDPDGVKVAGIVLDRVSKSFQTADGRNSVLAVQNISLTIAPTRFVALLGPSGCGIKKEAGKKT